jgi:hypothetical protein
MSRFTTSSHRAVNLGTVPDGDLGWRAAPSTPPWSSLAADGSRQPHDGWIVVLMRDSWVSGIRRRVTANDITRRLSLDPAVPIHRPDRGLTLPERSAVGTS